ncbi:unnamed protein product [Ilex paraguariensis]|uniref:Uncharacterized protein n=1 Tax=Ilex paraguariensis TaxID=185542 RepID=A0ABC8T002_9AQUA
MTKRYLLWMLCKAVYKVLHPVQSEKKGLNLVGRRSSIVGSYLWLARWHILGLLAPDPLRDTWDEVDPDELSYEELLALGDIVGTESRGLSAATIASLPSENYKSQHTEVGSSDFCVICRLDYEDGDTLTVDSSFEFCSTLVSVTWNLNNTWLGKQLCIGFELERFTSCWGSTVADFVQRQVCPVCSAEVSVYGNS